MAYRSALCVFMAVCGTQNATHADNESSVSAARSFRYPGCVKNYRVVITLGLARKAGD